MKTLHLNAYGVTEMNQAEMQLVEGGNLANDIAKVLRVIADVIEYIFGE
jgi:hypothetical protein